MPPPPTGLPAAVQVAGPAQAPATTPAPTLPPETPAPWQQDITKLDLILNQFLRESQMYARICAMALRLQVVTCLEKSQILKNVENTIRVDTF